MRKMDNEEKKVKEKGRGTGEGKKRTQGKMDTKKMKKTENYGGGRQDRSRRGGEERGSTFWRPRCLLPLCLCEHLAQKGTRRRGRGRGRRDQEKRETKTVS